VSRVREPNTAEIYILYVHRTGAGPREGRVRVGSAVIVVYSVLLVSFFFVLSVFIVQFLWFPRFACLASPKVNLVVQV
jgi:hypothetical protein